MINLYGVFFVDDNHIEILAAGCIHLECLALNFCTRIKGSSFKNLLQRCRKLQCLLLQNTGINQLHPSTISRSLVIGIEDKAMLTAEWESSVINELDISSTELTETCLLNIFARMPKLNYLAIPNCDGFTDQVDLENVAFVVLLWSIFKVLDQLIDQGKLSNLRAIDLSNTVNLNVEAVFTLLKHHGRQLRGLSYAGNAKITEQFWINAIRNLKHIRYFILFEKQVKVRSIMHDLNREITDR